MSTADTSVLPVELAVTVPNVIVCPLVAVTEGARKSKAVPATFDVINNLTNVSMNMSASRSQIEDADYAHASTELAKTQIMQQAATAVLAQANTSQQSVLKLLGG